MTGTGTATAIKSGPSRGLKRLRLRWAVIALALWATAFFAWRFSHRGDPRFVGHWGFEARGAGSAAMELEFTRFGTGNRRLSRSGQEAPIEDFTWRVEGEYLTFYWAEDKSLRTLFVNLWRQFQGEPEIGAYNYHFEQVGDDRFRFRNSIGSQQIAFELTRIEEE